MKSIIIAATMMLSTMAYADNASMTVFAGRAVSNSISDQKSTAWGVEEEIPTGRFGTLDFGYMNEGHQAGDKRDGIYAMKKFAYQFSPRVETSFALGPYFTATTLTQPDEIHYTDHYSWAGLASARMKYAVDQNWGITANWSHVLYARENKDADVFLLGVSYTPSK